VFDVTRSRVTVDIPGRQCSLSTVEPIGAHLALQLPDERALELSDQLARVLEGGDEQ
jgi:hypothetical protein